MPRRRHALFLIARFRAWRPRDLRLHRRRLTDLLKKLRDALPGRRVLRCRVGSLSPGQNLFDFPHVLRAEFPRLFFELPALLGFARDPLRGTQAHLIILPHHRELDPHRERVLIDRAHVLRSRHQLYLQLRDAPRNQRMLARSACV